MLTLLHLPYSPWSERARWALAHHQVACRRQAYTPMLGEPWLRMRLGRFAGPKPTVPVLFGDGWAIADSFAIARYADQIGSASPLRFADREPELRAWNQRSDELMDAGRARTTARVMQSPEALLESLPAPLSKLGSAGLPIAKQGARFLWSKYGMQQLDAERQLERMSAVLAELGEALANRDYLLGSFSYADIVMAVALQFVSPLPGRRSKLGARSRTLWTEPALSREHAALIEWRDALYQRYRN